MALRHVVDFIEADFRERGIDAAVLKGKDALTEEHGGEGRVVLVPTTFEYVATDKIGGNNPCVAVRQQQFEVHVWHVDEDSAEALADRFVAALRRAACGNSASGAGKFNRAINTEEDGVEIVFEAGVNIQVTEHEPLTVVQKPVTPVQTSKLVMSSGDVTGCGG